MYSHHKLNNYDCEAVYNLIFTYRFQWIFFPSKCPQSKSFYMSKIIFKTLKKKTN